MSLEDFKEDFERDYQAQEDQRDAANEDMRFVTVDGGQWEGWLEDEDRTKLEFDITSDYVDRFIGREEINSIGIKFEPDQGDASEEDAELLSGLYLKDYSKGDGEIATLVAKREAVTCGVGAFRFMAMPADEEDPESPLKVVHRPIYSAHSTVVWDSGSKRQDKADAKRVTILIAFTRKGYEKAYPEFPAPVSLQKQDRSEFNWSTQDLVYVAERIHIERNPVQVYLFVNPVTKQKQWVDGPDLDSIEDELFDSGFEQSGPPKKIIRREVFKTIFHGNEILEKTVRIPGKHLTVIPFYGKYGFVDGRETYEGMVRGLKDPQRIFNLQVSAIADDARDTNKDIPIFDPAQVEGLTGQFEQDMNDLPFLQVRALRNETTDQIEHLGPLGFLPSRKLDDNAAALMQITSQYMDKKTGALLGLDKDPDASGAAKREDRKEVDISTAHYVKSLRIGMKRAGDVYLSMAQEVYADQRSIKIMSEDGESKFVNLQEHVMDEETGLLVPVHDITRGNFEVVVKAGPQYETAREATVEALKEILGNLAQGNVFEAPVMAALMANMPGVGIDELRDMARKQMLILGMREPESEEDMQIVQQAQQQQQDGQQELIEAVSLEQRTQAEKNRAATIKDLSVADLNREKTFETRAKTMEANAKTLETNANVVDIQEGMKDRRIKLLVDSTQPLR